MKKKLSIFLFSILILCFTLISNWAEAYNNISKIKDENTFIIVTDKRIKDFNIDDIKKTLFTIESISNMSYVTYDFTDKWISEYLKENEIKYLPAILFNSNSVDEEINPFLIKIKKDDKYRLEFWANFNPFIKLSERGFKFIELDLLKKLKNNSYINWNINSQITWLNYSDLECPFCQKLHNSWTIKAIKNKYNDKINMIFNHFPLPFHKNALSASKVLECTWKQKGTKAYYELINYSFENKISNAYKLKEKASLLWANLTLLNTCISSTNTLAIINNQKKIGSETFWITWTPWNVIINNITWEYVVISWAYPTDFFIKTIDSLLIKTLLRKEIRNKYINNKKITKSLDKIDDLIWQLKLKQLSYIWRKINKFSRKYENKNDTQSKIIKDLLKYITKTINMNKDNFVKIGSNISVSYKWTFENWEVFDSTKLHGWKFLNFTAGKWMMIKWFDKWVIWMKLWETKTITIQPKDAYWTAEESTHELAWKVLIFEVTIENIK